MPISPIDQARALLARGDQPQATARLSAAGDAGDALALVELAVWHLRGVDMPRDLPAARAALRRAVAIGHVDAALMEVALTANGSGAPADWSAALALLHTAAAGDYVAAGQLALVEAMALDDAGRPKAPPEPTVLSTACNVRRYPAFLTPAECEHVARAAHDLLQPATVFDPRTGRRSVHPVRTSEDTVIGPTREDLVIRAINHRIAAISDTHVDQGESLAVLRYRPGQQYRLHHDSIDGATNQRIRTVLVYLNDGFEGGATVFPELGLTITPAPGDAIVFDNVLPDGRADPRARHAGMPVRAGEKWLATRWIRAEPVDPWTIAD